MDGYIDEPGEPGGSVSTGPAGPPARWATVVTPVSSDAIISVLRSDRQWHVTPLKDGFALRVKRANRSLLAMGEVVPTDTGSRIQLALYPGERSGLMAGIFSVVTAILSIPPLVGWVQHGVWGWTLAPPVAAALVTLVFVDHQSARITDTDQAAVVKAVVRVLRGSDKP